MFSFSDSVICEVDYLVSETMYDKTHGGHTDAIDLGLLWRGNWLTFFTQAIIWPPLNYCQWIQRKKLGEIELECFSLKKMHLKMSSAYGSNFV